MHVTALHLYPVKSLGGVPLETTEVEPWGFAGDRRWALVDGTGEPVTARECHALLRLTAAPVDDDTIRITDRADGASLLVDTPLGVGRVPVAFSRLAAATPADDDVSDWLTERAGRAVRLVWQEDPTERTLNEDRGGMPGESLSLADAGPVLLASTASLAQLDAWVEADAGTSAGLDMRRFRPNLVIDGDEPFAEDAWPTVWVGDVHFRTTMVCDRCVMTTLDPDTLASGKEPIRTLARHRQWDHSTWFGTRLVRIGGGETVHVGDTVAPGPPPA